MYDFYKKVKYLIINKLRFSCTSFECLFFYAFISWKNRFNMFA